VEYILGVYSTTPAAGSISKLNTFVWEAHATSYCNCGKLDCKIILLVLLSWHPYSSLGLVCILRNYNSVFWSDDIEERNAGVQKQKIIDLRGRDNDAVEKIYIHQRKPLPSLPSPIYHYH
jgi:hypothetical protein